MYIGGGWGNAIYFWDKEKTRIYGFKKDNFEEGSVLFDLANNKYNETIPLYLITNIEYEYDPSDMFFADISLIGNVENYIKGVGEYPINWFKGHLTDIREDYENTYKQTSIFKFKERRRLRTLINTLNELELV